MKNLYLLPFYILIATINLQAADNDNQIIALLDSIRLRDIARIDQLLNGNIDVNLFCIIKRDPAATIISKEKPPRGLIYYTPLHFAVGFNDLHTSIIIKKLIEHDKAIVDVKSWSFETPLHIAVRTGNIKAARTLLACNANVHEASFMNTPLHSAAHRDDRESVMMLLENGADPHETNLFQQTPEQEAEAKGHLEIAQIINDWNASFPDVKGALTKEEIN